MINRKKVQKIVHKYVEESVSDGKPNPKIVLFYSSEFKKLPGNQAIIYLSEYIKALRKKVDSYVLHIESSQKLTSAQRDKISRLIKTFYPVSQVVEEIDPKLLGGVRVKIGDHVFEDTIQSRIEQIGEAIHG
jgi:F0F1-type ATP synthase delta subunit